MRLSLRLTPWLAAAALTLALTPLAAAQASPDAPPTPAADARPEPAWPEADGAARVRVFDALVDLFRDYYWDPARLDWGAWAASYREDAVNAAQRPLFDAIMRRMVAEVGDDHSRWLGLQASSADEFGAQAPGVSLGFGLKVRFLGGIGLVVERVLPETPAEDAGVLRGDVIEAVDGRDLRSLSALAASEVLAGTVDAGLAVIGLRRGAQGAMRLELVPRLLDHPILELSPYATLLEPQIGFLYLPSFTLPGTAARAHELLAELAAAGARDFVIDLRGNLGGNLGELALFIGAFLDGEWVRAVARGEVVWRASFVRAPDGAAARLVSPEGRLVREFGLSQPFRVRGQVAVLVDRLTSSAAEVAAAVLQARGVAKVVGTATSGNVEVVQGFGLPDGSTVLIAVANLELPDGSPLDLGISPEVSAQAEVRELARGFDGAIAGALGALAQLPFTPGRWF